MRGHYSKEELVNKLKNLGLKKGDIIFSHIDLSNLGLLQNQHTPELMVKSFIDAIISVIGLKGTFLTPVFTYSYCKKEVFDDSSNNSDCGAFGKILLKSNNVKRSSDPNFSVAGFGFFINELFLNLPHTSFGEDCLYHRLIKNNAKILNIGLDLFYLTPIHYFENTISVPYRYNKLFTGQSILNGVKQEQVWEYYVRDLNLLSEPDCSELQREGIKKRLVKQTKIGLGEMYTVQLKEYFKLAKQKCIEDPFFLTINAKWKNKVNNYVK